MKTTKSAFDLIKDEFCNRYGIQPEQINISIGIHRLDSQELAQQIASDYAVEGNEVKSVEVEKTCSTGYFVSNFGKAPDVSAFAYWKELK